MRCWLLGARVWAWDESEAARAKILPVEGRWRAQRDGGVSGFGGDSRTLTPLHHPAAPGGPPPLAGEDLQIADPLTLDLIGFEAVVVSPGVPINRHPIAAHAAKFGVPLIGDIELFAQARAELPPHKVVGITGTNGKSTTTALVTHILKTAGVPALMGGNIGLPILAQDPLPKSGVYVLELSSYQIDLTHSLDCDVAVLLNITPDHLDRYESFEAYKLAKMHLFHMQDQTKGHLAVVSEPWPVSIEFQESIPNWSIWWISQDDHSAQQIKWPSLQGPHNHENAAAAYATCRELGLEESTIYAAMRTYPGLPHRMERIAERGGVLFVNDSKATNPTSTAPALAAYPKVRWILGGLAKTDDLDACAPHFSHVRSAYTIGEAGALFARVLAPHMPVAECIVLDEAVKRAANDAEPGDTVLLSPACASFDQFKDYEARGDAFRAAVGALQ